MHNSRFEPPPDLLKRRLSGLLLLGAIGGGLLARASEAVIEVWTGPGCGCCHDWVAYLEENGFEVTTHEGGNHAARARLGMPVRFGSCHTAEAGGYAIEGHVPAREIRRLLAEQPSAVGISVPAMPRGSPGMDGPAYRGIQDPYDVLLIDSDGTSSVFQSYR
jgi:hypothetical protein